MERKIPLRYQADWRSLLLLMLLTVLLAVQWSGLLRHWILLLASCLLVFSACIIKHNHQHCATFTERGFNNVFGILLSLLSGTTSSGIITAHNKNHHQHLNSELDFVRTTLVRSKNNLWNLITFPFISMAVMYRDRPNDLALWKEHNRVLYKQALRERVILYGFILSALLIDWRSSLIYLGIPWIVGQLALVTINLLQHQDCRIESEYDHSRNITGALSNWLFFNNGFHTAHHLKPGLHWSLLPAYHKEYVEPFIDLKLNHRSLSAALWRQFFLNFNREVRGEQ